MLSISEPEPVEVQKFPYPYQGAFTVASDIDSASIGRFRAIHALFCGRDLIKENSPEWIALGLTTNCPRFNARTGGVPGLGFDFADSFFLIGDPTTFGMYRYATKEGCFREDEQQGENCADLVRSWLNQGHIDSFHAFLHYTRDQVKPLLEEFYHWCEHEGVAKPAVWINHSAAVTPSGLCPDRLQPSCLYRLARLTARKIAGPFFGRRPLPLRYALVRYRGDTPGSPYYVNDLLAANGLRYVWLNMADSHCDQIALKEQQRGTRATILQPVTMDDGIQYYQFGRCHGRPLGGPIREAYLRNSKEGLDASHLINEKNLEYLCRCNGTSILYTHWTHYRSVPIADETIGRFELLQRWQDAGKIWITSTARLLEWTRQRTFLCLHCWREGKRLTVEIDGINDPIFGHEAVNLAELDGLCFGLRQSEGDITIAVKGEVLGANQVHRVGQLCWLGERPRFQLAGAA
jgi:hypothetical protein